MAADRGNAPMTGGVDVSAHVLDLLDQHILTMQRLRARMRMRTTTTPGARYALALDSLRAARDFGARLGAVLLTRPVRHRASVTVRRGGRAGGR
ncbi:hypothetical protein AB0M02_38945 [Actinoplanes sp. NPDC051861]|uniref:hypothetical protein n=1 Tax=Actinoplanes sp. NPDC051861 TaxID=3155170 RepID=UPI003436A92F